MDQVDGIRTEHMPAVSSGAVLARHEHKEKPNMDSETWTWEQLVEKEPRLLALERLAIDRYRAGKGQWHTTWMIFRRLNPLVGRQAGDPELRSQAASGAAMDRLMFAITTGQRGSMGALLKERGLEPTREASEELFRWGKRQWERDPPAKWCPGLETLDSQQPGGDVPQGAGEHDIAATRRPLPHPAE